jgi:voltage-gated potassium channel
MTSRRESDVLQDELPARVVARSLLRSACASALLLAAYYVVPLNLPDESAIVWLVVGLVGVTAVLAWQIQAITTARYPRLRAISALAVGVPLVLVVFAVTYLLIAKDDATAFSTPLDRTGAIYFTVTVFATVGFGDIVPVTTPARVGVIIQMLLDLVLFGVAAKVVLGAVNVGLRRRDEHTGRDRDARDPDRGASPPP